MMTAFEIIALCLLFLIAIYTGTSANYLKRIYHGKDEQDETADWAKNKYSI